MKSVFIGVSFIFATYMPVAAQKYKNIPADFPKEMLPEVKVEYQKTYDKGQILYNINCAKCHTTFVKRKTIIPDFLPEQLKGYELREANERHVEEIKEEHVTPEELGVIMTFLMYKKKSGVPHKKG